MSYNVVPLETFRVKDPRTKLNEERKFAILQGGQYVSYKNFTTTSFNNSALQFSTPPPSPGVIVDRKIYLRMQFRISFTSAGGVGAQNILQPNFDAPRAFPLSSVISNLAVTINNNSAQINLSDVIHALTRYNTDQVTRDIEYGTIPTKQDESQEYAALIGAARNPLNLYGDNPYEVGRGGFPYTIVSNSPTAAAVDITLTEPIFLSPWLFGCGDFPGFIGVQSMSWNFQLGDLSRLWSHAVFNPAFPTPANAYSILSSTSVAITGTPALLFTYITPKEIQDIPRSISYSYFNVQRYPTNYSGLVDPSTPSINNGITIQSNNIQLQSIPRRIFLYVRRTNANLTISTTDTFFAIDSISVNWNNQSGLLSSASAQDLYNISKSNGLSMDWTQYYGFTYDHGYGVNDYFGTVGSVICLEMGKDIGLGSSQCPGQLGTYQLQIDVRCRNISRGGITDPVLYVTTVDEGTWTIIDNTSLSSIGVVSHKDVLDASMRPEIDPIILDNYYGGNFFSGLKDFGEKILHGVNKAMPTLETIAQVAGPLLPLLAAGPKAGALVGGGSNGYPSTRDTNHNFVGGRKMRAKTIRERLAD